MKNQELIDECCKHQNCSECSYGKKCDLFRENNKNNPYCLTPEEFDSQHCRIVGVFETPEGTSKVLETLDYKLFAIPMDFFEREVGT